VLHTYLLVIGATLAVSVISFVGVLALPVSKNKQGPILILVSLAVGALLGDAMFHLLPEAAADPSISHRWPMLAVIGILAFFLLEKVLCHLHPHAHGERHGHGPDGTHGHHALGKMNLLADGLKRAAASCRHQGFAGKSP
jgi:zinc and cadmium transporter